MHSNGNESQVEITSLVAGLFAVRRSRLSDENLWMNEQRE